MKLPWERNPHDREANYRKPVPRAEGLRVGIKGAAIVGGGVAYRFAILDRTHEGAKLILVAGAAMLIAGITDLVYLRSHEIDRIFLKTTAQQRAVQWTLVAAGVVLLVMGAVAYAR